MENEASLLYGPEGYLVASSCAPGSNGREKGFCEAYMAETSPIPRIISPNLNAAIIKNPDVHLAEGLGFRGLGIGGYLRN